MGLERKRRRLGKKSGQFIGIGEKMAIQSVLSAQEKANLVQETDVFNKKLNNGKPVLPNQNLGKDDFLKLLLTQLAYQDPTAPMEDKEFIAQMAQFSSLEQMNNMAADFAKMASMLSVTEASSALGKSVELTQGDEVIQGAVRAVTREAMPQVLVNGAYYQWAQVTKVYEE
jgi:flagellar basal-body rod modification protein FlgD